jgi:hypothetical protein
MRMFLVEELLGRVRLHDAVHEAVQQVDLAQRGYRDGLTVAAAGDLEVVEVAVRADDEDRIGMLLEHLLRPVDLGLGVVDAEVEEAEALALVFEQLEVRATSR